MRLKGKVALITGASRGIGKEIARVFAKEGASVVATAVNNMKMLEELYNLPEFNENNLLNCKLEASSRGDFNKIIKATLEKFKKIDIVVNNAGVFQVKPFMEITDEDWDYTFNANLKSIFMCCQEVIPALLENGGGKIINLASIAGQIGSDTCVHYCASKAGIISLTKSLDKAYAEKNIQINSIAPGLIKTDMINDENIQEILKNDKIPKITADYIGDVSDVAYAALYLASDEARYINGQTINVNGGMYYS